MKTLIEKIEAYGFECQGGPLTSCEDWHALKRLIQNTAVTSVESLRLCNAVIKSHEQAHKVAAMILADVAPGPL